MTERELAGRVDGKRVFERRDVVFRSTDFPTMKFNQFMMLPYFPRLAASAQPDALD